MKILLLACVLALVYAEQSSVSGPQFTQYMTKCQGQNPEDPQYSEEWNSLLCAGKKCNIITKDKKNEYKISLYGTLKLCESACNSTMIDQLQCKINTLTCFLTAIDKNCCCMKEEAPYAKIINCIIKLNTTSLINIK